MCIAKINLSPEYRCYLLAALSFCIRFAFRSKMFIDDSAAAQQELVDTFFPCSKSLPVMLPSERKVVICEQNSKHSNCPKPTLDSVESNLQPCSVVSMGNVKTAGRHGCIVNSLGGIRIGSSRNKNVNCNRKNWRDNGSCGN